MGRYIQTTTYTHLGQRLQEVEITPIEELEIPKRKINSLLRKVYPHRCYNNAFLVANKIGCEYVEGEIIIDDSVSSIHAWNSYKGKYFDLTRHKYPINEAKIYYFPVVQGTIETVISQGYKFDNMLDIVTQYWNRPENRKIYQQRLYK